ncbi:MAG: TAXI family TRAP transporter solute-binding subunit [Rhodospirillaceae bacterium]|nr:TAXI family TRAP transporter solute-binding subunit [Rhodospirillaceae bacterium]
MRFPGLSAKRLFDAVTGLTLILATLVLVAVSGLALAQDTKVIRIGAGPTGVTDFPFGGLVANAISNPPGSRDCDRGGSCGVPGLIAVAQTTADVVENLRAVSRGDLELGLAPADVTLWAAQATGAFAEQEPLSNLRVLARLYPENVHLITRTDSPIKAVTDLKGKKVAMGPEGSGTAATAKFILSAYGVKWSSGSKAGVKTQYMDFSALADAFAKGAVDAAFIVSGAPTLAVEDIAARIPIKVVPISGPVAEKLAQVFPFYSRGVIPAGTYAGQPAVETLDVGAVLVSRDTMDPELAYGVVRAVWHERNRALFQAGHPRGKLMDKSLAARNIGIPIQTGADRYYVENGLMDAAAIVPPPAKAPAAPAKPKAERGPGASGANRS